MLGLVKYKKGIIFSQIDLIEREKERERDSERQRERGKDRETERQRDREKQLRMHVDLYIFGCMSLFTNKI